MEAAWISCGPFAVAFSHTAVQTLKAGHRGQVTHSSVLVRGVKSVQDLARLLIADGYSGTRDAISRSPGSQVDATIRERRPCT